MAEETRITLEAQICPECGALWENSTSCDDNFYQMLYWENENIEKNGVVHNLTVLSYYLQHPSRYSPEGLEYSKGLLLDWLERGITPQETRRDRRDQVDSGKRDFKVTARPGRAGAYAHPVRWRMTARDVVQAGEPRYVESVRRWAQTILEDLRAASNI